MKKEQKNLKDYDGCDLGKLEDAKRNIVKQD